MKKHSSLKSIASFVMALVMIATTTISMAPVFASSGNKIVINAPKGEPGDQGRFVAYQIFKGTLTEGEEGKLGGVTWGDAIDTAKIMNALKSDNTSVGAKTFGAEFTEDFQTYESEHKEQLTEAEFVAQWLAKKSEGKTERSDANPYANAFAKIVAENLKPDAKSIASTKQDNGDVGVQWTINVEEAGYYLVKDTYVGTEASVSTYIIDVLGVQNVDLKASIPTVEKRVEDDHGDLSDGAIYRPYEAANFMIAGTVAKNIDEYKTYKYILTDTLSKGLDLVKYGSGTLVGIGDVKESANIKVYVYNGKSLPDSIKAVTEAVSSGTASEVVTGWTAKYTSGDEGKKTLTIEFANLKTTTVKEGSYIIVVYSAMMNKDAVIGKVGNENSVILTYSNNPYNDDSTGKTAPNAAKIYTVGFNVAKVDGSDNDNPLGGAAFKLKRWNWSTIPEADGNGDEWNKVTQEFKGKVQWAVVETVAGEGPDSSPKYVIKSWVDDEGSATLLSMSEQGKMQIVGLRGFDITHAHGESHQYKANYALVEETVPEGYEKMMDIVFTVNITVDTKGDLTTATIHRHASNEHREDVSMDNGNNLLDIVTLATLTLKNFKQPLLPHTGGIGRMAIVAIGIAIISCGTIFALSPDRKNKKNKKNKKSKNDKSSTSNTSTVE